VPEEENLFLKAFVALPPDGQARVQAWLGTQMFLARELGISPEDWLAEVERAFAFPFDFSFATADRAALEELVLDGAERRAMSRLLGDSRSPEPRPADGGRRQGPKAGLVTTRLLHDLFLRTSTARETHNSTGQVGENPTQNPDEGG
jgi:hypothetical protein